MPSPKSGNAGNAVSPADPQAAQPADKATPGQSTQAQANPQQSSQKPYKPDKKKKGWIEIELVDEENNPVPGESYRVTLPDGETVAEGTLDDKGFARVDGIDSGSCKITFPDLDEEAWEKA